MSATQRALEPAAAQPEQAPGRRDIAAQLPELLKTVEASDLLRFDGPRAVKDFFKWADRNAVPRLHRGRSVLWEKRVLLDFLHGARWTKRR
jgi:hypothetical protein